MNSRRAGFTILEIMMALCVLGLVMGSFLQSFQGFTRLEERSDAKYTAAVDAAAAMQMVRRDLSRSGFVLVNGLDYPTTFPAGLPPAALPEFGHEKPNKMKGKGKGKGTGAAPDEAADPDEDDGINQEAVVLLPLDADGDGWPDVDVDGNPVWDLDAIGFQLVPQPEGYNNLVRVRQSGPQVILARHVSQFLIESPADTGYTIPLDTLRVSLTVQRQASAGGVQEEQMVELVQLRNGGLGL